MLLEVIKECRKGIFFVRLNGELTKETIGFFKEEVTNIVKYNEIRNILFNLNELYFIDKTGIDEIYNNFEISKRNNGYNFICCTNLLKKKFKNNSVKIISNELSAFYYI